MEGGGSTSLEVGTRGYETVDLAHIKGLPSSAVQLPPASGQMVALVTRAICELARGYEEAATTVVDGSLLACSSELETHSQVIVLTKVASPASTSKSAHGKRAPSTPPPLLVAHAPKSRCKSPEARSSTWGVR